MCACATQVFVTPTAATIRERHLFRSAQVEVRLLIESATNQEQCLIEQIWYMGMHVVINTEVFKLIEF